jgi:hypothetical protein
LPEAIQNHIAGLLKCGMTAKQVEEKVFSRGQGPEYRQAIERAGGGNLTTQDIRNMSKALGMEMSQLLSDCFGKSE